MWIGLLHKIGRSTNELHLIRRPAILARFLLEEVNPRRFANFCSCAFKKGGVWTCVQRAMYQQARR
jgi:hypothetical protein